MYLLLTHAGTLFRWTLGNRNPSRNRVTPQRLLGATFNALFGCTISCIQGGLALLTDVDRACQQARCRVLDSPAGLQLVAGETDRRMHARRYGGQGRLISFARSIHSVGNTVVVLLVLVLSSPETASTVPTHPARPCIRGDNDSTSQPNQRSSSQQSVTL